MSRKKKSSIAIRISRPQDVQTAVARSVSFFRQRSGRLGSSIAHTLASATGNDGAPQLPPSDASMDIHVDEGDPFSGFNINDEPTVFNCDEPCGEHIDIKSPPVGIFTTTL